MITHIATRDTASEAQGAAVRADPRWARIVARDPSADGAFWYSVATTGVYCRPSCPSRGCNPANVAIHDTLDQARATGCRACRRCLPDGPSRQAMNAAAVARACRMIDEAETPPGLATLAAAVELSPAYFHRVFKSVAGVTPKAYADASRAARLRATLATAGSVTEAIYDAGFGSNSRFYASSTSRLGMTPKAWRAGGAREELRFAIGECSLGTILVASSARGVASILLGDDPDALLRELQDRFPKAGLVGGDPGYEAVVAQVVGLIDAPHLGLGHLGLSLPLDIRGTAFQQRVWQALRQIPPGTTESYATIAARIGAPQATRAVAGACAANALAVAIPCHRVVRSDGGLSGYRWGVERKRRLLERESAA